MNLKITKEEKKELYVNPNEFWENIKTYYSDKTDKWPIKLGFMIDKIATKMRWKNNFSGYKNFIDEMVSDAKLKMIEILLEKKFNLYSYTPLSKDNYKIINNIYYIREYKRGSDQRGKVEGGKNERGMIIFVPNGDFRLLNRIDNLDEELIVDKRGDDIYYDGNIIFHLKEDDMKKYDKWDGLCLRTRNIAFGYFSQTCKNCYIARIKKEKHNEEIKQAIMEKTWDEVGDRGDGWEKIRAPKGCDDDECFYDSEY